MKRSQGVLIECFSPERSYCCGEFLTVVSSLQIPYSVWKYVRARVVIQIQLSMPAGSQNGRRTSALDRPTQGFLHGVGFARFGNDSQYPFDGKKRRDGQRQGLHGNILQAGKVAFANLLPPGRPGQRDLLDRGRIMKIGERRIVERQRAVLAESRRAYISRMIPQQLLVFPARRVRG
jgi:hypothetical protein